MFEAVNLNQNRSSSVSTKEGNGSFFKPVIQPKLTFNQPGDVYEQEADAMADKVMRMPVNEHSFFSPQPLSISRMPRKCQHCEEEEKMHRKESNNEAMVADSATESYISSLNGKGKSLTHEERGFFEPRFGYDFSDVQKQTAPPLVLTKPATPHVCGPNVTTQISTVWSKIQSDFRSWSPVDKLASAIYLISPYVPQAGINPRAAGGSSLFSGSWIEPFISIIATLSRDPAISSYISMTNSQWQLNRDAFDTIGLFVLSAGWLFSVPGCAIPACSGLSSSALPRGESDPCEDAASCSMTVQMGGSCWLSGTVNYGTYGIMMKEVYNWCDAQRSRMLSLLPGILLRSLGNMNVAIALLRASMTDQEIAAAFLKELFSFTSVAIYVGGYKLWDMENPMDPLSWASGTYNGGAAAIPAGSNRPLCKTTCSPFDPSMFSGWDYVWEPVKRR